MSSNTAKLIENALKRLEGRKTQEQVAREAGFSRPNMLSMLKHNKARLPLERVPALAEALEIEPALLFRVAMAELWPNYERVINQIFRDVLSEKEWRIIRLYRELANDDVRK